MSRRDPPAIEEWKPIPGFEGFYEVSTLGRVRSVDREVIIAASSRRGKTVTRFKGRVLKGYVTNGRPGVNLFRGSKGTSAMIAYLVAEVFVGPCPNGSQLWYRNGITTDCSAANLYWGRHYNAKLTDAEVLTIRNLAGEVTQEALAERFGVSQITISGVIRKKWWRHVSEGGAE